MTQDPAAEQILTSMRAALRDACATSVVATMADEVTSLVVTPHMYWDEDTMDYTLSGWMVSLQGPLPVPEMIHWCQNFQEVGAYLGSGAMGDMTQVSWCGREEL